MITARITLYTIVAGLTIVILVNLLLSPPRFSSSREKAAFLSEAGRYREAEMEYRQAIKNTPGDIELYHHLVEAHFQATAGQSPATHTRLLTFFDSLIALNTPPLLDIGLYGKSLVYSYQDRIDQALHYLNRIHNRNLRYLNNSVGYCLTRKGKDREAEKYFLKEIRLKGNVRAAYENLAQLYNRTGHQQQLALLLEDPVAPSFISFNLKREYYFFRGELLNYFTVIASTLQEKTNLYGFTAAFFILVIWIIYLRRLDIYEQEKWRWIIITLLLGILFAQGTFLLNDVNELVLGNRLSGDFFHEFVYCFLGIGAIEELVKILPMFLILVCTREINEPIDYLKYASISAAGFAFTENLLYFNSDSLHIIPSRALICVTGHMFYSSVIAYGVMIARYRNHRHPWLTALISFLLASFFHGFYDFWLINQTFREFSFFSFLFFLLSTLAWIALINNCLSNSPFYDDEKELDAVKLRDHLFASLIAVFIIQFLLISFKMGPAEGNLALARESILGLIILPLAVHNMSNVRILKNYWSHHLLSNHKIFFDHLPGKRISMAINPHNNKNLITLNSTIGGVIGRRTVIANNPNWFQVQMEEPVVHNDVYHRTLFISPRKLTPRKKQYTFEAYLLIPSLEDLDTDLKEPKKLEFGGLMEVTLVLDPKQNKA